MKKLISILLCICFILTAFSVLFAVPFIEMNPFAELDSLRNEMIGAALSESVFGTAQEGEGKLGCIVKFKDDAKLTDIYECVENYSYRLLANSSERLFWLDAEAELFCMLYESIVETAENEQTLTLSAVVNDPLADTQWELEQLQIYRAWDITYGVRDVTVAVLDSGIYREHPDFENVSILAGYDAVTRTEGVNEDVNGHGTKITSIIAAATDNGIGMAGIAANVTVLPIRISNSTGYIHSADFIDAVYHAADAGADIINMSFGGYTYSAMEELAVQYANEKGCVLISAAGNNETSAQYAGKKAYPASYNYVISVGAIDETGALCPFSQRNDAVDLVAPGAEVTVANTNGGYEKESGTSFASAYVTGIAALCFSAIDKNVRFTGEQFLSLIANINGNESIEGYGYGLIRAHSTVENINLPLISGVSDGGVYHRNVTVTFNRGKATLDGEDFESGDTVITSGSHTLTVVDGANKVTVDFITDNIPLKYEFSSGIDSAAITFTRGTATVDGIPYLSGTPITTDGKHYFKLTGPYGNTASYEFECNFTAPEVFGVVNGGVYTTPVHISAGVGSVLTLNGTVIPAEKVIAESGSYTLVSATADGKHQKTVYFTVSLPNVALFNSSVVTPKVIADDKYQIMVLYNDVLSGIRVFSWSDLTKTKCFIRTHSAVLSHSFFGEKLVLIHADGVTVGDRQAISAGNSADLVYHRFEKQATAAVALGGYVYYTCFDGSDTKLWRMDASTGKNALITSIVGRMDYLATDGELIAAADKNGKLCVFDRAGKISFNADMNDTVNSIAIYGNYLCTDKCVYGTQSKEKLFSLNEGETVIFADNNVLVTSGSVYDLKGRRTIARFDDKTVDAVITDSGYTFKTTAGMKIELINNGSLKLNTENAAQMLNAAPFNGYDFGKKENFSVHESFVKLPDALYIKDAVIPETKNSIFAIAPYERTLYIINCDTLAVTDRINLRFQPAAICTDGNNIYISFKDERCIFVCPTNGSAGKYMDCNELYTKLLYQNKKLFGLTEKGDIYAFSANDPKSANLVMRSQNVLNFTCDSKYLYAQLKPVNIPMLYKINLEDYSIENAVQISDGVERIETAGGMVFVGNKAYSTEDLELAYTLNSTVKIGYKNYVLTESGLYQADTGALIGDARTGTALPLFDSKYNYYSFEKGKLCKIRNLRSDLHSLPTISGIKQDDIVKGPAAVEFNYGYAYLDGSPYTSGTYIENGGLHSLVISLPFGVTHTVSFVIEAKINSLMLTADKYSISVNEITNLTVTAIPYTYGVVDVVYTTDNGNAIVLQDGSVIGVSEGNCTITATTVDGNHSANFTLNITKGVLRFDSSYFYADVYNRIVRGISPGTGVETFLAAAAETHGTVAIRGYNGVVVSAGMIHTGMTAELYDIYGKVIDSWGLSVIGDIDGDGYVTANDYFRLEKLIENADGASASVLAAADIDGNRFTNAFDLLALKQHFCGNPFIGNEGTVPAKEANTLFHLLMPQSLSPGTSFTVGLTITQMKNITAVSGALKFNKDLLKVKSVKVYGADAEGFYTVGNGSVYFFSSCNESYETDVLLTAEFELTDKAKVGERLEIATEDLLIYDGSAAVAGNANASADITKNPKTDILIFNLPEFKFDSALIDYRLQLPTDTQEINVSAYPQAKCDIVGDTVFQDTNSTSFAVVVKEDDKTTQYSFVCERKEGTTQAPGGNNTYKSSNASIYSLTVEGGTLSPKFDKAITSYYVITKDYKNVKISALPENEKAIVSVGEYNEEDGTVTVTCTAEDGTVANYTLHLCKKPPVFYNIVNNEYLWLWLFAIPLVLLASFGIYYYLNKKPTDKKPY